MCGRVLWSLDRKQFLNLKMHQLSVNAGPCVWLLGPGSAHQAHARRLEARIRHKARRMEAHIRHEGNWHGVRRLSDPQTWGV